MDSNLNVMSVIDIVNGVDDKIRKAESLYDEGLYREASAMLRLNDFQIITISTQQYLKLTYLDAECSFSMGEYEVARVLCNQIINYPGYNNNFISKAEALKKKLP